LAKPSIDPTRLYDAGKRLLTVTEGTPQTCTGKYQFETQRIKLGVESL